MMEKEHSLQTEREMNEDSINLLRECNAGCKSATGSIEQILPMISNDELRTLTERYQKLHENYGVECNKKLHREGEEGKEPNPVVKAGAWLSTEVKLAFRSDTERLAACLFDGCHMGIRSLLQYVHKFPAANEEAKHMAYRLIGLEEDFREELKRFL